MPVTCKRITKFEHEPPANILKLMHQFSQRLPTREEFAQLSAGDHSLSQYTSHRNAAGMPPDIALESHTPVYQKIGTQVSYERPNVSRSLLIPRTHRLGAVMVFRDPATGREYSAEYFFRIGGKKTLGKKMAV